jgi:hypothetical protein
VVELRAGRTNPADVLTAAAPVKAGISVISVVTSEWAAVLSVSPSFSTVTAVSAADAVPASRSIYKWEAPGRSIVSITPTTSVAEAPEVCSFMITVLLSGLIIRFS